MQRDNCNDVVSRTIVMGPLVAELRSQSHAVPCSPITRPHLPRYWSITLFDDINIFPWYLTSRKQSNEVSPVWLSCQKDSVSCLASWPKWPTLRKGISKISPSWGYGVGLLWIRRSKLYEKVTSLLEPA